MLLLFIPHPSPLCLVRVERFELSEKLILSQPPLPIGLHARRPLPIFDCRVPVVSKVQRLMSNVRSIGNDFARGGIRTHTAQILNLSSPANWTTRAKTFAIFDCRLLIVSKVRNRGRSNVRQSDKSKIDNWQSAKIGTGGGIRTHTV